VVVPAVRMSPCGSVRWLCVLTHLTSFIRFTWFTCAPRQSLAHLLGFTYINGDKMNRSKMGWMTRTSLLAGRSAILDNTNPSAAKRAEFVAVAQAAGVPAHCILLVVPEEQALYMNTLRSLRSDRKPVPKIAYNMYV
jgi:AAA domain